MNVEDSTSDRQKVRHSSLPDPSSIRKRGNYRYKVKVQPDFDLERNASSVTFISENSDRSTVPQRSNETLNTQGSSSRVHKPWYILHPDGLFRAFWDAFMLVLIIWIIFYVPFNICFESESDEPRRRNLHEIIIDVSFGIDIILNFLTAYIDPTSKRLVCSPKRIAIRYLKGFFSHRCHRNNTI